MKLSIMTRVFWRCYEWPGRTFNFTLVEILKRIMKSGYRAVDLCEYPLEFWPSTMSESEKKRLKELLEHLSLKASGITVPTFAPGLELSPVESDRALAFKRLKSAIHLAHYLEGDTVMYGISPVPVFDISGEKAYRWTLELISKSACLAEDNGVQLAIEFVNTFFNSSESILNFLETVGSENVGLCLEVGNVHARPSCESLEEHMDACKDWIKLVHLVDPANESWNKGIGADISLVLRRLRCIYYEGYLVMEGFSRDLKCSDLDEEVAASYKFLENLLA